TVVTAIPYFEYYVGPSFIRDADGPISFRVRSGPDDSKAPSVQSYDRTPASIDAAGSDASIASTLEVSDSRSGVAAGPVTHSLPRDPDRFQTRAHLHLSAGTKHHGTWAGTALLTPCGITAGRWLTKIEVRDASGNRIRLGPRVLSAGGWPAETQVAGADN